MMAVWRTGATTALVGKARSTADALVVAHPATVQKSQGRELSTSAPVRALFWLVRLSVRGREQAWAKA